MGGRNLQGREVTYLSSCEYLPFDDSRQIDGLLLCFLCDNHISFHYSSFSWFELPNLNKKRYQGTAIWVPSYGFFMLAGQMKKVRRRIQWNYCDFSVMCMLENGISSLPCWIQLNGHWLPISPGVSFYLMHLVRP